ncbi:MAG: hypothetical protein RB289_11410 [Paludibacter sp.]|jgi:hypothetical protein|nr:hypothetical protein [Paludibacter sp.]
MTAKIFSESNNVFQDQAKILFNYYSRAAEKIVAEEERLEREIAVLEEEKSVLQKQVAGLWIWFLTIILFFVYFIKKNALVKEIAEKDSRIEEFKKQHGEIFRDYKVSKLAVAYVPVADQIRYEDKSFIVDYTGKVDDSEVVLQLSRRNDLLIDTIADLESLSSEAPVVETSIETESIETDAYSTSIQEINQHDYFGKLERSLRTISYCMDDLDTSSVTLPLVADKSEYLEFLNEYATSDIPEGAPVVDVFDKQKYAASINKFQELNRLKDSLSNKTQQFEDVLKGLMMTMANSVQAISALKIASTDKVIFESNKVLYQILKAPYNHYSPILEHEEIDRIRNEKFDYSESVEGYEPFQLKPSSRVRYNLVSGLWTAEDGSTTNSPFGVHQIFEEIVAPVVQNLMQENRIERLKIYNHIKDQKISYLNKWHQDTDAFYRSNRAESADIINLMQAGLREYVAAYNTLVSLQRTEDSMLKSDGNLDATVVNVVDNAAETLAAFEMQSQEFKNTQTEFEDYIERLKEDIDQKAEKFGHIEFYDAKLRDGHSNEIAVAANEVHNLDERRKPLSLVNPLFAKTSELPPSPNVEEITFEHISLNLPVFAKNALEDLSAAESGDESDADEEADAEALQDAHPESDVPEIMDEKHAGSEPEEEAEEEETVEDEDEDEVEDEEEDDEDDDEGDDDADDDDADDEADYIYTEAELSELDDEVLREILDAYDLEYDADTFDRAQAIADILGAQDEIDNA